MTSATPPPVDPPPNLTESPLYLLAVLYAARRSNDRALEEVTRRRLNKLGVRVVFAANLPTLPKGVPHG